MPTIFPSQSTSGPPLAAWHKKLTYAQPTTHTKKIEILGHKKV
jgi:hypothetical protein